MRRVYRIIIRYCSRMRKRRRITIWYQIVNEMRDHAPIVQPSIHRQDIDAIPANRPESAHTLVCERLAGGELLAQLHITQIESLWLWSWGYCWDLKKFSFVFFFCKFYSYHFYIKLYKFIYYIHLFFTNLKYIECSRYFLRMFVFYNV